MNPTGSLLTFSFAKATAFDEVRHYLPPALLALSAKGPAIFGLPPATVALAGLAHLAAGTGRLTLVNDGSHSIAPCFNLVLLSDQLPVGDWLSCIGSGWLEAASKLRASVTAPDARRVLRNCIHEVATREARVPTGDPQISDYMKNLPRHMIDLLRVEFTCSSVDPAAIGRALLRSRDQCVTLLNGAYDPMMECARLTPANQRKLCATLLLSWQGRALELDPCGSGVDASVCCLWQTQTAVARRALFASRRIGQELPIPLLFHLMPDSPKRFPDVDAIELKAWSRWLSELFSTRISSPAFQVPLPRDFNRAAEEFFQQVDADVQRQPSHVQPWLIWTPDLLQRVFAMLSWENALRTKVDGKPHPAQPTRSHSHGDPIPPLRGAISLTSWMLQEHHRALMKLMGPTSEQPTLDSTDNTDNEGLPEAILRRLSDHGPLSRRDLQRKFHRISAKERDEVLQMLKSQGRVVESPDGQLTIPTMSAHDDGRQPVSADAR